MRIRPFFWLLLLCSCVSVLIFAATFHPHVPAELVVHVDEPGFVSTGMTSLDLHLTDPQGLPIEEAEVLSHARMTNMDMSTANSQVKALGDGKYKVQLHLTMVGPWAITIQAQANGFAPLQRTLLVQVE